MEGLEHAEYIAVLLQQSTNDTKWDGMGGTCMYARRWRLSVVMLLSVTIVAIVDKIVCLEKCSVPR